MVGLSLSAEKVEEPTFDEQRFHGHVKMYGMQKNRVTLFVVYINV